MAIGDDFSIGLNGDIRRAVATPVRRRVLELHRWLQGGADDESPATADDLISRISRNPSSKSTDNIIELLNGYNLDDDAAQWFFDGTVIQDNGNTIFDGIQVIAPPGTYLEIIQNGALITPNFWTTGINADAAAGYSHQFMVKVRADGVDIDGRKLIGITREWGKSFSERPINATARGNNAMALVFADDLNNQSLIGTIAGYTDITNTEGLRLIDVDNNGTPEEYYSEWNRGTRTINDLYERAKWITRRGTLETIHGINGALFRGITHSQPWDAEVGGISVATNDILAWGTQVFYDNETVAAFQIGEALHEDSATPLWKGRVIALDDNGTFGSLLVDLEFGTIGDNQGFTGQTSGAKADTNGVPVPVAGGGTLLVLAVDDDGSSGNLYYQLIKGTAPTDNLSLYKNDDHTDFLTMSSDATVRSVSTPFIGISTGSALIGAYGLGIEATDLSAQDLLTDLSDAAIAPPNLVTLLFENLVVGDSVLAIPDDGAGFIDFDQMTLNGALTGAAVTSVVVNGAIPADAPNTGTFRLTRDDGEVSIISYTSWDGSTFTIPATDFSTNNASNGNGLTVSYLDLFATATTESVAFVFASPRSLFISVRNSNTGEEIVPFENVVTVGSNGLTVSVVRNSD